jgi:histidine ammonia-lyase
MLVSAGNFHGQPLAFALDALAMAVSELANISERRVERLVNPNLSDGLPAFLTTDGGLNSGFMIPQYVAASLVSENKSLCHPASVDSIPTSANQEDHVSMGPIAGRHARTVLDAVEKIVAIELLCAARALDLRLAEPAFDGVKPGAGVVEAHARVRAVSRPWDTDREPAADIEAVARLAHEGGLADLASAQGGAAR